MRTKRLSNFVSGSIGTLFLAFVVLLVIVPIAYFIGFSFSSANEIYDFPKQMLPKLSYDLKVNYQDNMYNVAFKDSDGNYELVISTDELYKVNSILSREYSIVKDLDELEQDFLPAVNGEELEITYEKDMLYNFKLFFEIVKDAFPGMINSLVAAGWTILISSTIGSLAGYSLARYNFKGKSFANIMILIVRMFPSIAISVPMIIILANMNLSGSMLGLAIVYSIPNIGLTCWITKSVFMGIGVELEEAAQVFGATKLRTFFGITFPLALPGLAASAMYGFLAAWNDSITALILAPSNPTLSLAIYKGLGSADIQLSAAGAIILILPALVFTFIIKGKLTSLWGDVKV